MNKTEAAFAYQLEAKKRDGLIHDWFYESLTFKLGHDCRLTPDFLVIHMDGMIELFEVKGRKGSTYYAREDAKVKLRVVAKAFPFKFTVTWPGAAGGWDSETL
jgi:hypothetical protein